MGENALQKQRLEQIRKGDNKSIETLYKDAFPYCASFVLKNQGTREDAKEVFQESLLILIKTARKPNFEIQHSLKAFLYGVVRNLWLKQLNQRKKSGLDLIIDEPDKNFVIIHEDEIELKKELEARYQGLYDAMQKLKDDCRKLLNLTFYQKLSDKEVAPILNYSLEFVRQKRRRCVKQLKKLTAM